MRSLWKSHVALATRVGVVLLVFFCACTILDDSDLRSPADFNKLQLQSIRIVQVINDRSKLGSGTVVTSKSLATIIGDSVVTDVVGVSHVVWYALGPLGDNKLKFRSGTTGSVKIYVTYTDTNEPYTLGVLNSSNEVVELYRFRYYESGRLARINSFIVRAPGDTLAIRDSLFYSTEGKINLIRRNDTDTGEGSATMDYRMGTPAMVNHINYSNGQSIQYDGSGNCGDKVADNFYCGDYGQQSNGPQAEVDVSILSNYSKVESLRLLDSRNGSSGTCQNCGRDLDTYYFHPTMFLANDLQSGSDLLEYYMRDWWEVAPNSSGNLGGVNDETVSFEFLYAPPTP